MADDRIEAVLLKPINGNRVGAKVFYSPADFARLEESGDVKAVVSEKEKAKEDPAPAKSKGKAKGD